MSKKYVFILLMALIGSGFAFAQVKMSKKPIILECKFNDFNVRKIPDPKKQEFARLKAGDKVQYLGKKTSKEFTYELRGKKYTNPFIQVKLDNGDVGWVFQGGFTRYVRPRIDAHRMLLYKHYYDEKTLDEHKEEGSLDKHYSSLRKVDAQKFNELADKLKVNAYFVYTGVSGESEFDAEITYVDTDYERKDFFKDYKQFEKAYENDYYTPKTAILLMEKGKKDLLIEGLDYNDPYFLAIATTYFGFDDIDTLNEQIDELRKGKNAVLKKNDKTYLRYIPGPLSGDYLSSFAKTEECTLIPAPENAQITFYIDKAKADPDWVLLARTNHVIGWTQKPNVQFLNKANTMGPLITEYKDDLDF